jgi:uncharacterized protein YceK
MTVLRLALISMLLASCSSVASRVGENYQWGRPYAGLGYALENMKNCNVAALITFPPALLVSLPVSLVDLVFSAVSETVLLPVDWLIESGEEQHKRSVCHMDWSK